MPSLNRIEIMGNVGKQPEMRFTSSGMPVTNFSIAVNRKYETSDGVKKEETEWFNIVCWRRLAERVNQYVSVGMPLYISGSIHLHEWETEQHEKRSRLQLNANTVIFLSKKSVNDGYDIPAGVDGEEEFLPDDISF